MNTQLLWGVSFQNSHRWQIQQFILSKRNTTKKFFLEFSKTFHAAAVSEHPGTKLCDVNFQKSAPLDSNHVSLIKLFHHIYFSGNSPTFFFTLTCYMIHINLSELIQYNVNSLKRYTICHPTLRFVGVVDTLMMKCCTDLCLDSRKS